MNEGEIDYEIIQELVNHLIRLYIHGRPDQTFVMLGAIVNATLIAMQPSDRKKFIKIVEGIQAESEGLVFEDGQDYLNFLKERGLHGF